MITILTGNNASGKTKFLRKKYNEVKDKKVLVNFDVYQNNKKYNIEDATVDEINWRDFVGFLEGIIAYANVGLLKILMLHHTNTISTV